MEIAFLPPWLLTRICPRVNARDLNLLLSGCLLVAVVFVGCNGVERIPHICLSQAILGIPCPGCGIIHSVNASLHLRFAQAWTANPAGILVALALLVQILSNICALNLASRASSVKRAHSSLVHAVTVSLLVVWVVRVIPRIL